MTQKSEMRTAVKRAKSAIETNADNKSELVNFAIKKVDKAAQRNLIHSNKADRIYDQLCLSGLSCVAQLYLLF